MDRIEELEKKIARIEQYIKGLDDVLSDMVMEHYQEKLVKAESQAMHCQ